MSGWREDREVDEWVDGFHVSACVLCLYVCLFIAVWVCFVDVIHEPSELQRRLTYGRGYAVNDSHISASQFVSRTVIVTCPCLCSYCEIPFCELWIRATLCLKLAWSWD